MPRRQPKAMVKVLVPEAELAPTDALFVLYALEHAGYIHGNLKLQKVGFWTELKLHLSNKKWPSFRFYRWNHGPFSAELQSAFHELRRRNFVAPDQHRAAERGKYLLSIAIPTLREISENAPIFEAVDAALEACRGKNGSKLRDDSYKIQWIYGDKRNATMADLPHGASLVVPSAGTALVVPDWLNQFVANDLSTPDEALREAEGQLPQLNREILRDLNEAFPVS